MPENMQMSVKVMMKLLKTRVFVHAGAEGDFVQWVSHSADSGGANDGCVLGYKETFLRLRKGSVCWKGRDYAVTKKLAPCPCTVDDYHWYVFLKHQNTVDRNP